MAKKQIRSSQNQSTAKKPSEVSPTTKKPLEQVPSISKKKKEQLPPESSSDEEMETELDSSSEEEDNAKPKQPSASVSLTPNSDSETENDVSDHSPAPIASPPRTLRKRMTSPEVNASTSKRSKMESETDTAKKGLIQRVWTEEDEIGLLQSVLEFKEETGKNPSEDLSGIYEIVKESVYVKGKSFKQFNSKVVKLKSKYLKNKKKSGVYTKPHDLTCIDLCNKIWVTDTDLDATVKSNKKMKVVDDVKEDSDWFEKSYVVGAIKYLGMDDDKALKKKWSLVPVEMKKTLEEEFKLMQAKDIEQMMLKAKFLVKVTSAIGNA